MKNIIQILKTDKLFVIIFLTGLIIRLIGINFGLPNYFLNSDENEYVSAAEAAVLGVVSPYKTGLPINIFYYILTAFYYVYHFFSSVHLSPGFFIVGRALSVFLSVLSVALIYLIGRNLFDRKVGLFAAAALAFFPVDVHIAHYIKEDVYIQFFGMLSLYFLSELQTKCKERYAFFAVIAAVLTGSAKLNGFFYVLPIAIYLLFLDEKAVPNFRNLTKINMYKSYLFLLVIFSVLFYFLSTPISFMDSDPSKKYSLSALINPEHEVTTMSSSADGIPNFLWWPVYLISFGTGYILTPLFLFALIYIFRKKLRLIWPYLIFVLLYTGALLIQTQRFDRWITIVTPLLALFLGVFVNEFRNRKVILGLFWLGLVYNFLISSNLSIQLTREDTRSRAVDYIVAYIPKDQIIFFQEGLDPAKHYLNNLGYEVYDYSCRTQDRLIDLAEQGSIYVVVNNTFSNLSSRFPDSDLKRAVSDCGDIVQQNGKTVAYFSNKLIDNNLFGYDTFVGPATVRYLHFPKTQIIKTNDAVEKYTFEYSPEFAQKYTKKMKWENEVLLADQDTRATLQGPYIPIPPGQYKATIDFDLPNIQEPLEKSILVFGVTLSSLEEPVLIEIKSPTDNKTVEFKTDRVSKLEFPVIFTGETQVKFNKITLEQI